MGSLNFCPELIPNLKTAEKVFDYFCLAKYYNQIIVIQQ